MITPSAHTNIDASAMMTLSRQAHDWLVQAPTTAFYVLATLGMLAFAVCIVLAIVLGRQWERSVWEAERVRLADQRQGLSLQEEQICRLRARAPFEDPMVAYPDAGGVAIPQSLASRLQRDRNA